MIRTIIRGCRSNHNQATFWLWMFVGTASLAAMQVAVKHNEVFAIDPTQQMPLWFAAILGAGLMLLLLGPPYICVAHHVGKQEEADDDTHAKDPFA